MLPATSQLVLRGSRPALSAVREFHIPTTHVGSLPRPPALLGTT